MRYTYIRREFPRSSPLASALVIVAGAVIISVALILGFFAFLGLSALVLVSAGVMAVRAEDLVALVGTHALEVAHDRVGPAAADPGGDEAFAGLREVPRPQHHAGGVEVSGRLGPLDHVEVAVREDDGEGPCAMRTLRCGPAGLGG